MPQLQWRIIDLSLGRNGKYIKATREEILNNWENSDKQKTVKLSYGRSNYIEFNIFRSDEYTRHLSKLYDNIELIKNKYQIVFVNALVYIKSQGRKIKAESTIELLTEAENMEMKYPRYKGKWVELDELESIMIGLEEKLENVEEYKIIDQLVI
jgi:hypothetical protein